MKRRKKISLSQYTPDHILTIADDLITADTERDTAMRRMNKIYDMDVYLEQKRTDEIRIALPTATDTVDKMTAILCAMPPVIGIRADTSSPPSASQTNGNDRKQKLEEYLYTTTYATNLNMHRQMAIHHALRLGEGWIKLIKDDYFANHESPLKLATPDPLTIHYIASPTDDLPTTLIESTQRTRRSIEDEWDIKLPGRPTNPIALQSWLKEEIDYLEYWDTKTVFEIPEDTSDSYLEDPLEPDPAEPLLVTHASTPDPYANVYKSSPQPISSSNTGPAKPVRVTKIIHAVLTRTTGNNQTAHFIQRPLIYPGLTRIPFFPTYGKHVIRNGQRQGLPLLYAITGGSKPDQALGILQSRNILLNLGLEIASAMGGKTAYITDDPNLKTLDLSPGALNYTTLGHSVRPVWAEANIQLAINLYQQLGNQLYESTIPQVYAGATQQSLSGSAIEGYGTIFTWTLTAAQEQQSRQIESLLTTILALTRYYCDPDGWEIHGRGRYGNATITTITPDDIQTTDRVEVKLSSSLPKDKNQYLQMLPGLVAQGFMTQEQAIDETQKLLGNADQAPKATQQRIIQEKLFWTLIPRMAAQLDPKDPAITALFEIFKEQLRTYTSELIPNHTQPPTLDLSPNPLFQPMPTPPSPPSFNQPSPTTPISSQSSQLQPQDILNLFGT